MDTVAVCAIEPVAIEGLRSLLESAEGLSFVASETSLHHGLEAVIELRPTLLLVDKAFGANAVIDCANTIRQLGCPTAVIVWGASFAEAEALRFLQCGAAGVLRKTARLDVLITCLRAVACGAAWMEEEVLRESHQSAPRTRDALTARELQVMELVEYGLRNKEIASKLGIRTGTVKIHLKHIFEKTGIRGRYGLAISGLKEKGLLVPALLEM